MAERNRPVHTVSYRIPSSLSGGAEEAPQWDALSPPPHSGARRLVLDTQFLGQPLEHVLGHGAQVIVWLPAPLFSGCTVVD